MDKNNTNNVDNKQDRVIHYEASANRSYVLVLDGFQRSFYRYMFVLVDNRGNKCIGDKRILCVINEQCF